MRDFFSTVYILHRCSTIVKQHDYHKIIPKIQSILPPPKNSNSRKSNKSSKTIIFHYFHLSDNNLISLFFSTMSIKQHTNPKTMAPHCYNHQLSEPNKQTEEKRVIPISKSQEPTHILQIYPSKIDLTPT